MKLATLYEQVVGHWQTIYSPYHINPKMRKKKKKQDLSFRVKGKKKISHSKKEPEGGDDGTGALETGARPISHRKQKINKMGMEVKGGSDLAGQPGKVAGGELKSAQDRTSKGIRLKYR